MSIQCDMCDAWTHFECAKLTSQQVDSIINYFCEGCRDDDEHLITWRRLTATKEQRVMKSKHYYDVELIKDHRNEGSGREFLVEWKGCPVRPGSDTNVTSWEPEKHLDGCIDLLQQYCMQRQIQLSSIQGLMGADSDNNDHETSNWIDMNILLNKFVQVRRWTKTVSTLTASEWTEFGNQDKLYFLRHDHHCYVLLHVVARQLAFIADGTNTYRTNKQVAQQLQDILRIRLISLKFNQQLEIDHCGSSAILIGLELLRMHYRGIQLQELTASKALREDVVRSLHAKKSKSVDLPPLGQRRRALTCTFCKRKFKANQGRALNKHIFNNHTS